MTKISFRGVTGFEPIQRVSISGAWQKRRTQFFSKYMPAAAARRVARSFNITPGSKHYNPNIMDGMRELDDYITKAMGIHKVSRSEAVRIVWDNLRKSYIASGRTIESSQDLLHWWLSDNVS